MTDAAKDGEADTSKAAVPVEAIERLKKFNETLTALEDALKPHLREPFEEHISVSVPSSFIVANLHDLQREPLSMARVDLTALFTVNSLCWSLLSLRGKDVKNNETLKAELVSDFFFLTFTYR